MNFFKDEFFFADVSNSIEYVFLILKKKQLVDGLTPDTASTLQFLITQVFVVCVWECECVCVCAHVWVWVWV